MMLTAPPLPVAQRGRGVTAVLGPTNTGKTTLALDRMLAHSSGVIGLPLRLLAREVYAKLVAKTGAEHVALVTGEEKIKPPKARYWVSTVEAMPLDLDVAFLAIDEVQIAADLERGHVFTDRILNRRGRDETMLLGAATMRPVIERLIPGAAIVTRPRFSHLFFAGEKKLTRLPRRTAIVAFSADEVYAIAELIRRQRGGAAVVLGALSPRTRNAQVELYQSGDVDYLVATDAIGMGLNLDVEHVAFAADRKFDGYQFRKLNPSEFAQIAGRAGRSNRDGTFGTTGRCPPFEPELVQALESHSFDGVKMLQWRNAHLDFSSVETLRASLDVVPAEAGLTRAPLADDQRVLEIALRDPDVKAAALGANAVSRLWDACLLPDYRKISLASHAELVISLYGHLMGKAGRIPSDWMARQVAFADRTDGDIDTLSNRIAHIRTWTFAASRPDWVDDPTHWQAITRGIEDKLSDALHERLTQRFVDRRTSVLMRRLREKTMLEAEITKTGDVTVEGQHVGRLEGFRFAPDASAGDGEAGKALRAAAVRALAGEIEARAARLSGSADDAFILSNDGTVRWHGEAVAKLTAGDAVLAPRVRILADEHLTGASRDGVQARLDLFVDAHVEKLLGPVRTLTREESLQGLARGIAFQIAENLGVIERQKIANDIKQLDQDGRAALRKLGVRFGAYHLFLPTTLKPAPRALALRLSMLKAGEVSDKALVDLPALAASGRTSIAVDADIPRDLYRLVGFRALGPRAVRVDILERLADIIRPALAWKPGSPGPEPAGCFPGGGFTATVGMTSLVGCAGEDFAAILKGLGYRMEKRPAPAPAAPLPTIDTSADAPPEIMGGSEASEAVEADAEPVEVAAEPNVLDEAMVTEPATSSAPAVDGAVEAALPTAEVAEAVLVEVWRPGGRMDGERPRVDQRRQRGGDRGAKGAPQPAGEVAPGEPSRDGRPRRAWGKADGERQGEPKKPWDGKPRGEGKRPDGGKKPWEGKRRDDGERSGRPPGREKRPDWRQDMPAERTPRADRQPDPNSPFAKLAALKEQMVKK